MPQNEYHNQRVLSSALTQVSENKNNHSKAEIFIRLTRTQFTPLVLLPALAGTAFAYSNIGKLNLLYLGVTLIGVFFLHLGANGIDDCYDFQNGVDSVANSMFPPDFAGWKPIPRGLISLKNAKLVSYSLFFGSLAMAALFWYLVGLPAFLLGVAGVILAIIYTAPPLKVDYRGIGLGEISIFFAFGPIAFLGSYFVQATHLTLNAFLVSVPIGLMTVTILLDHDMIFYEVYTRARKLSLAAVLGRKKTLATSLSLSIVAYALTLALVAFKVLPLWSVAAPIVSLLILLRKRSAYAKPNESPPFYVPLTQNGLLADWLFTLVLAISLLI